jgi:hypothetical protein
MIGHLLFLVEVGNHRSIDELGIKVRTNLIFQGSLKQVEARELVFCAEL